MKKRIFAIAMLLILGIISPLCTTKAYAAKDYSANLNALAGPYKGYTSIDDLEMQRNQGKTLTSLNFSGQECVNYATTRLKEKVFGCSVSFGIYTGHGKDVANSFITYGYGVGGKNSNKVFTAKDGQQYTVTAYTNDNGTHISPNSLVCFNKNSNMTNSQYGHVVFVEETPIIDGIKYVYYTEGGNSLKSWPVKRQTFDAFYNQGIGYTGTIAVTSISNNNIATDIISGVYSLTPKCAPNSRLDVANGSKEKGANIQIHQANNTDAQQFEFKYLGEGYYQITSKVSGKSLDVQNGNNKSGANVWQYDSNSTDAQKWMLEKAEDDYYYIVPKLNTNLCLDVYNAKKDNGTNVQVWSKNQSDAQKWKLTSVQSPVQHSNSLPTNLTVSTDKNSYTLGESVLITPSANNATHYAISVWKGAFGTGDRVYVNFKIPGRISFNPTQSGTYTIRVDAKNGAGYISTEKTFTVAATAPGEPTEQKTWGNWSNWSTDYVESSDTRQVETTSVKVADSYTEYRYGRYIDSTGTHVCWCKKYLESWRSVSGSASLQYSEWSATRYNANGKAWTCGYCGGDHTGVHHVSSDGRAWWAQFDLPSGSYYWEESRNVDARYETQYRYRDLI